MASCGEIRKKLFGLHLAFLGPGARREVLRHLAGCPACRCVSEAIQSDMTSLKAWGDEPPPGDVVDAVMREISGSVPDPARPETRRKTEGIDLSALLGDGSLESLEKELEDLESLVVVNRDPGPGGGMDLSRADLYGDRERGIPGKLTAGGREKILEALGLDEDPPGSVTAGADAPLALEAMARFADRTARRKTGSRVGAEGAWNEIPRPGASPSVSGKSEEADALLGTTILPAPPRSSTKRFSSRLLTRIHLEEAGHRKRKRVVKRAGFLSLPVLLAVGLHLFAALVLGTLLFLPGKKGPPSHAVITLKERIVEPPKPPGPEPPRKQPKDLDPTRDSADPRADARDAPPADSTSGSLPTVAPVPREGAAPEPRPGGSFDPGDRAGGVGNGGRSEAVERGLDWLARHQDDDGKWDWVGYTRRCRRGLCDCPHGVDPSVAREGRNFTMGLTGLALLGYLGSAYTHVNLPEARRAESSEVFLKRHDKYKETVRKALRYLTRQQGPDGCFTPPDRLDLPFEGYMYNQGICALAVLEAYILTGDRALERPCRRAVRFIEKAQNPKTGGWDYRSYGRPEGRWSRRCDVSVSSWQVMALKAAADAGLPVDARVWTRAKRYFRCRTRRDGSMQYASGTRGNALNLATPEHLRRNSVGVTSAGLLSKMILGASLSAPDIRKGASLLIRELPDPNRLDAPALPGRRHNFHTVYYWFYGSLVLYHLGGEPWNAWRERLVDMLVRTQNTTGAAGSWDPCEDFLGRYGGRLYVTAFHILNLEVLHRYTPLWKRGEGK